LITLFNGAVPTAVFTLGQLRCENYLIDS